MGVSSSTYGIFRDYCSDSLRHAASTTHNQQLGDLAAISPNLRLACINLHGEGGGNVEEEKPVGK